MAASPAKSTPPSRGSSSEMCPSVCPGVWSAVAPNGSTSPSATSCSTAMGSPVLAAVLAPIDAHDQRPHHAGTRLERPAAHALAQGRGVLGLHPDLGAGVLLDGGEPADVVAVQVRDDDAAELPRRAAQRPEPAADALRAGLRAGVDEPEPALVVLHEERVHAAQPELIHATRDLLRHRRFHRRSFAGITVRLKYATRAADLVVPLPSEQA